MQNYFQNMLPAEELARLQYIPTIPEFVTWIEREWSDLPALSDTNRRYTYGEMCALVGRKRALLNGLGLAAGDKVAIWDNSTIDAVMMFLAVTSGGYEALLLPAQLPVQKAVGCCALFGVKVLAIGEGFSVEGQAVPCPVIAMKDVADEAAPVAVVDKESPAAIFFTGGTTGDPKGAVLPHRAIMRGSLNGCYAPGHQLGCNRYANVLPLSHVFGLIRGTMSALYTGAEWVSTGDTRTTIGKLPVIRPTVMVAVPGICEILMGLIKMYGKPFLGGELRFIISGAANVPPKLIRELDSLGVTVFAGYGLTEGANLTSGNIDVFTRSTSVGQIYPEQETRVVDGELWLRGDNIFLGYYGNPALTSTVLTPDGWLKTGDLVKFDEDGYMYIVGRIKNLIILSSGENISPESLEEPFYQCDKLRDCLVKEEQVDGRGILAIEILPRMEMFEGVEWADIEKFFSELTDKINSTLPTSHRIVKMTVRKEDFKRTGTMKVSRK